MDTQALSQAASQAVSALKQPRQRKPRAQILVAPPTESEATAPPVGAKAARNASPLLSIYGLVRETLGSIATSGWRPVFCWGAVSVVLFAFAMNALGANIDLDPFYRLADLVLAVFFYRGAIDKGGLADLAHAVGGAISKARGAPPGGAVAAG